MKPAARHQLLLNFMRMKKRAQFYWLSQMGGWGIFVLGNLVSSRIQGQNLENLYRAGLVVFLTGIGITHFFRMWIHYQGWKKLNVISLIPRALLAAVVMSMLFITLNKLLQFDSGPFPPFKDNALELMDKLKSFSFWQDTVNFSALFLLWSILYFAVNTFENWKREEINNLELRAAKTEIELNSFKAQMNPHFMFNSMNSIRALVDENPDKAKQAITMLSGLLRNNLTLGKNQTIPLRDELDLVDKYLSLEKIRFEERLVVKMQIAPETLMMEFPPFMLQTLVENAIKHGISRRVEGGEIRISIQTDTKFLSVAVYNSGQIQEQTSTEGIGLANTRKRLELIYGQSATFSMREKAGEVIVELEIPLNQEKKIK
jgi:two-component system, LytTR family, sensor kinase